MRELYVLKSEAKAIIAIGANVYDEAVTFTGTSGTLAYTPRTGTLRLHKNGARLVIGSGNGFTHVGAAITLTTAAEADDKFFADYVWACPAEPHHYAGTPSFSQKAKSRGANGYR